METLITNSQASGRKIVALTNRPYEKKDKLEGSTKSQLIPPETLNIVANEEIKMFKYQFDQELTISKFETITDLKGHFLIKYDAKRQPKDYKAQIEMKQADELSSTIQNLTFRCLGCELKPDTTFRCIFQEIPLPAPNELYAQNPRKLSVSITGSLVNFGVTGLLTWNEVGGRPAWVRIKMKLQETGF